ncbi:hypothetical protein I4F81_011520 [Pyropia yezoensis]|uniref:Uncharacterized protein n=1 Tax=Pyropia yezoensis TaxID=2788 RepID=A0ACC3CGN6_PYRYE|nr:hypothetical protein I4F81_011520 [Neopyropia yezoensis]
MGLGDNLKDAASNVSDAAGKAGEKAKETATDAKDATGDAANDASRAARDASKDAKRWPLPLAVGGRPRSAPGVVGGAGLQGGALGACHVTGSSAQ